MTGSTPTDGEPRKLRLPSLALSLEAGLHENGVSFTHWKSNCRLGLRDGYEVELDLLVPQRDRDGLGAVLGDLGFRRLESFHASHVPDVHHYYGLEDDGSCLVHAHVYHRVVTGESLVKNYELPVANQLLAGKQRFRGFPVPAPAIELVVFTIRVMIKHASWVERQLLYRDFGAVDDEVAWLLEQGDELLTEGMNQLRENLPALQEPLIREALEVLTRDVSVWRRNRVARRLRHSLKAYRRFGHFEATMRTVALLGRRVRRKVAGAPAARGLATGGRVIAFVGPEASGKSSLAEGATRFFGKAFAVRTVHFGKPPATLATAIPRLAVPMLRALMPEARPTRVEAQPHPPAAGSESAQRPSVGRLLYAARSVMLARERRALAHWAFVRAAKGEVILCDRFPSKVVGAADSPRLFECLTSGLMSRVYNSLVSLERVTYQAITPPDAVIRLAVPLEDAVRRNDERVKAGKEAEEYVRQRHAKAGLLTYPGTPVLVLNTAGDFEDTVRRSRLKVWEALGLDT